MGKDFDIVKLSGSDNYHTWKFAVENVLAFQGLSAALNPSSSMTPNVATLTDVEKLSKAKAIICLSVQPSIYAHIQKAGSALEIWNILKKLYEDRGLSREVSLVQEFMSIRLESSENMNDYISKLKTTANKLTGIGFPLTDRVLVAFTLAGLTDEFRPVTLSLESNETPPTADFVMTKLMDLQSSNGESSTAFFNKNKKKFKNKKKCYTCGSKSHLSNSCDKKDSKGEKSDKNNKKDDSKKNVAFVAFMCKEKECDDEWYIDSGTGRHMTPNGKDMFETKKSNIKEITSANNGKMQVEKSGKLKIELTETNIIADEVLHVPDMAVNLLSVFQICKKKHKVIFDENGCEIINANGETIVKCKPTNGVYKISKSRELCMYTDKNVETDALTWHRRLGHMNLNTMQKMKACVAGIDFTRGERSVKRCEICAKAKSTRLPFKASESKSKEILELIHTDVMGPMEIASINNRRYCVTFIDDYSRKVWVRFLYNKSEVLNEFKAFKTFVEKQTEKSIKKIRSDNGGEYDSDEFVKYCRENGIQHQFTTPYTPQQNGTSERMNRSLVEKAKCLLFDAELPKCFWAEAVNMAAFIMNHSICSVLKDKTPDGVFFNKDIDISNLKIFGSKVMVHVPKQKRRKWDATATAMIFVGYDNNTKGYRCIDRDSRKMQISRDVKFFEEILEQKTYIECNTDEESETENKINDEVDDLHEILTNETESDQTIDDSDVTETAYEGSGGESSDTSSDQSVINISNSPSASSTPTTGTPLGARARKPPLRYPLMMTFYVEPVTVKEAMEDDAVMWQAAMDSEMASHKLNETWILADLPKGRKAVKSKWVFKVKENADKKRFKARLVAKGFSQRYGIDYGETFSPVVRTATLRIMFAMAVHFEMKIHQLDAITAFLQGDLQESIYMEQPEGYQDGTNRVCKLKKAIYGLKQAGRMWNLKLCDSLEKYGLKQSNLDPCVFFNDSIIVLIYVDDMLIIYRSKSDLDDMKTYMYKHFHMKDIGHATKCIGIQINQSAKKIEIDQESYIDEVIERFLCGDCKIAKTPSDPNNKLSAAMVTNENELTGKVPYQEAVGSLLYLAQGSRPDISFAVNDVSRFNAKHGEDHWKAVIRIIRYLKYTKDLKLRYKKTGDTCDLHAYSDSDWASDLDKRRSCTGFIIKFCGAAVNWKSHRQEIVALSSTEAEYIALSETTKDILWIQQFINEIKKEFASGTVINIDNDSAISIGNVAAYRERTKHIDVRHHHVRQQIKLQKISLSYVSTQTNVADLLTKGVTGEKTRTCANGMGLKK